MKGLKGDAWDSSFMMVKDQTDVRRNGQERPKVEESIGLYQCILGFMVYNVICVYDI